MIIAKFLVLVLYMPATQGVLWSLLLDQQPAHLGVPQEPLIVRRYRHHHGQGTCINDRNCMREMFCDKHYRTCESHRKDGEFCRRDGHCEKGYECVFGFCRRVVKKGERGARCRNDTDCGSNMCCARHHGEFVCQQRLVMGQKCYVPFGGLDYSLNELCPCEEHLTCKYVEKSRKDVLRHQRHGHNHLRCALP